MRRVNDLIFWGNQNCAKNKRLLYEILDDAIDHESGLEQLGLDIYSEAEKTEAKRKLAEAELKDCIDDLNAAFGFKSAAQSD